MGNLVVALAIALMLSISVTVSVQRILRDLKIPRLVAELRQPSHSSCHYFCLERLALSLLQPKRHTSFELRHLEGS